MAKFSVKDRAEVVSAAIALEDIVTRSRAEIGEEIFKDLTAFAEETKNVDHSRLVAFPLIGGGEDSTSIGSVLLVKICRGACKVVQAIAAHSIYDQPKSTVSFVLALKDEVDDLGVKRACAAKALMGGCTEKDAMTIQLCDAVLIPGLIAKGEMPWEKTEGHTVWTVEQLLKTLRITFGLTDEGAKNAARDAVAYGMLSHGQVGSASDMLYLPVVKKIDEHLFALSKRVAPAMTADVETDGLVEEQIALVDGILAEGPIVRPFSAPGGTGKSHTVAKILAAFLRAGVKCAAVAPTGSAAKLLGDALDASGVSTSSLAFGGVVTVDRARVQPHIVADVKVLIIDEASMVSTRHLSFLAALPGLSRLIMMGDVSQLKPVGAGSPFVDLLPRRGGLTLVKNHRVSEGAVRLQSELHEIREKNRGRIHKCIPFAHGRYTRDWAGIRASFEDYAQNEACYAALRHELDAAIDSGTQILAHTNDFVTAAAKYVVEYLRPDRKEEVLRAHAIEAVGAYFGALRGRRPAPCDITLLPIGAQVCWTGERTDAGGGDRVYRGFVGEVQDGFVLWNGVTLEGGSTKVSLPMEMCAGKALPVQVKTVHKSQGQSVERVLYVLKSWCGDYDKNLTYTAASRAKETATVLSLCEPAGSIFLKDGSPRATFLGDLIDG